MWEKNTPKNWETGSSGFICFVFPAGLLLLLRLTYLSSHRLCCSRLLWHPPRLLSLLSACSYAWVSGGPRPRAGLCGAGCELLRAARLPLPQWGSLQGATGKGTGTQGDVPKLQQRGCHRKKSHLCVHSPPWTVLPLTLFFFSYLFLHSFFSRQHNSLSSPGYFSSSIPKPSWKICQTIFGASPNLVGVFKFSIISFFWWVVIRKAELWRWDYKE